MITSFLTAALLVTRISAIPRPAGHGQGHGGYYPPGHGDDELLTFIEKQRRISFQGVFNNIGPDGSKAPGASAGIIIASPETFDPDYFFTWTRDSGLTMKMIVDDFLTGDEHHVEHYITDYIKAQAILQTVSNPSGSLSSGRGLGEPKFYSNQTRFNRSWGRPQRDGPALRATAIMAYARYLIAEGRKAEVKNFWPVVQNDLAYVAQFWNSTGFDLWEEVNGRSFFASIAQYRALVEGANLGKELGIPCTACKSQAPNILCLLQSYWNGDFITANMGIEQQRTGIDSNTVLGSIASFDPLSECTDATYQPCSPRALASLKVYVDSFRGLYEINGNAPESEAIVTGRYAEDVYYDGNPWYLTTLAVAEQLYDAVQQWRYLGELIITDVDLKFWLAIYPDAAVGTYGADEYPDGDDSNGSIFDQLLEAAFGFADKFMEVTNKYIPEDGALSEQILANTSAQISAGDLTWSYASYITASAARRAAQIDDDEERQAIQVPSWGEAEANRVPAVCVASSVPGTYTPAVSAGAPEGSGLCTLSVTFNVNASTFFGENIYLFGNTTDLGLYAVADSIPASGAGYTNERPLWTVEVDLPADSGISYQYVRSEPDASWLYETVNRTYTVPACGSNPGTGTATVEDAWEGPSGTPVA